MARPKPTDPLDNPNSGKVVFPADKLRDAAVQISKNAGDACSKHDAYWRTVQNWIHRSAPKETPWLDPFQAEALEQQAKGFEQEKQDG